MYAPGPAQPRHFLFGALAALMTLVALVLVTGCGSAVADAAKEVTLKELAASNDQVQKDLADQKAKAKQSAADAIAAKLAAVTSDAKASASEKAAAEARAAAETAQELASVANEAAKVARKKAEDLAAAAEAERKHNQIVAAQATCHWIAGILTLIAILATIDVVASFFITQISRTRGIAEGVAAAGFASAGVVMIVATLVPYMWWIGAGMLAVVFGGYLYHRHDSATKTQAVGSAADDLTTELAKQVGTQQGGAVLTAVANSVAAKWRHVWGEVQTLVDKVSHSL